MACATPAAAPQTAPPRDAAGPDLALPAETHLANLRQLTFGGENAEAYWSWAGDAADPAGARRRGAGAIASIRHAARRADGASAASGDAARCRAGAARRRARISCPAISEVIYASTESAAPRARPRPITARATSGRSTDYDIFRANADGSSPRRLTTTPGYDAEGTVCGKDGSIVFTSVRDGDIELYRMDADGKNVKRLTNDVGYDGGAFFNADCSQHRLARVAAASRARSSTTTSALLAQNLVRPTKLELYVAERRRQRPARR